MIEYPKWKNTFVILAPKFQILHFLKLREAFWNYFCQVGLILVGKAPERNRSRSRNLYNYFSLQNTFKSQTQLEYLDLSHNGFEKIQPTFFNNLGRLLWLNVSNNAITEMSGRNFARNSLLRVLHMNHNRITRLDSNSFRGMRFMRRLYFSDNQITDVGRGTFRAVSRYVYLKW